MIKFSNKVGMDNWDRFDTAPHARQYMAVNKNKHEYKIEMKPSDYIGMCADGFGISFKELVESRLDNVARHEALNLKNYDLPCLDYTNGFSQEGITRCIRAMFQDDRKKVTVSIVEAFNKGEPTYY